MSFANYIAMAQDEHYSMTEKGLDTLLDVFEHLMTGGTIYNFPDPEFPAAAIVGMLATSWLDIRDMIDIKRRYKEQYGD